MQRSIDENLLLLTKKVLVRRKSRTLGGNPKKRENSDELMRPLNDFTTKYWWYSCIDEIQKEPLPF
jgi:hypothetical protein